MDCIWCLWEPEGVEAAEGYPEGFVKPRENWSNGTTTCNKSINIQYWSCIFSIQHTYSVSNVHIQYPTFNIHKPDASVYLTWKVNKPFSHMLCNLEPMVITRITPKTKPMRNWSRQYICNHEWGGCQTTFKTKQNSFGTKGEQKYLPFEKRNS